DLLENAVLLFLRRLTLASWLAAGESTPPRDLMVFLISRKRFSLFLVLLKATSKGTWPCMKSLTSKTCQLEESMSKRSTVLESSRFDSDACRFSGNFLKILNSAPTSSSVFGRLEISNRYLCFFSKERSDVKAREERGDRRKGKAVGERERFLHNKKQ
uniref:Uncharacterized protein n=1 Tax=Callorhinchus milii TaxID=7868 RepID=A0A4W3J4C0_CALMI